MKSTDLISVPVEINGVIVLVEATCLDPNFEYDSSDQEIEGKVSHRTFSFDEISETISAISGGLARTLSEVQPTKATVEFGVELQYQSGRLLTLIGQGSGKVNLKVSLEWSK
jgi:hypothetical protein